jgi:hypothetical protein
MFAQAVFENGECALARDEAIIEARVKAIMPAFDRIAQDVDKGFHVGIFFKVAEKLGQKEADRVIGRCQDRIPACHNGPDKREIDQG